VSACLYGALSNVIYLFNIELFWSFRLTNQVTLVILRKVKH
jgi:hypothetical protein